MPLQLPASLQEEARTRQSAVVEAIQALPKVAPAAHRHLQSGQFEQITAALVFSDFVTKTCIGTPGLLIDLLQSGDLQRTYSGEGFTRRANALWQTHCRQPLPPDPATVDGNTPLPDTIAAQTVGTALRRFRQREMVRIALRDLCHWADLDEIMADLSQLADTCITIALNQLYWNQCALWGPPLKPDGSVQQMVVLGLGKLGANELNFSSDVDLLFAYGRDGDTRGGTRRTQTNEAFFTCLARDLIKTISAPTADGFVFRVDARLRPYGEAGALVLPFDRLEAYYEEQGREWERYALIKARTVAGDQVAGAALLERLRPFVYRRYLDYGAFDSLRDMKARIMAEVRSKGLEDNIKLGSGGIREIEFFGQMFQLIRGGVDPALQARPIRTILKQLVNKRYIPASVRETLDAAYVFLRTVENRLQQWADRQTHSLPTDPPARLRLAMCMGFDTWDSFFTHITRHREQVHHHFGNLLASDKSQDSDTDRKEAFLELKNLWQGLVKPADALAALARLGYTDSPQALGLVQALREDNALKSLSDTGRNRLDRLVPLILQTSGHAEKPEAALSRLFDLIKSIRQRSSYLALLLENPSALAHLVRLSGDSPWISNFLCRHPVLLDELLDPRTLYRPPRQDELVTELNQRLEAADADDLEYQMEILRVFKQINVLRVAASDITHVLPLMRVSDHLSDLAEIILEKVVSICWRNLVQRYGTPSCHLKNSTCERGFAVIGYGKLGGLELGYGSDLDLVFLHCAQPGNTSLKSRAIDNAHFYGRLGQRVLHMLTTPTSAGVLYEADMRLRPSGASGMLVSHLDGFRDYQYNDAWIWEHQALIRARAVSGDPALQEQFARIRHDVLTLKRDGEKLREEVSTMRERLREQAADTPKDIFDVKQGLGGIVDIEFLVQYLILRYAHEHPEMVRWTDNVRLLQSLNEAGIIDNGTAFGLRRAYLIYRAMVHRLNLRQQPAQVEDGRFAAARGFVTDRWNHYLKASRKPIDISRPDR